MTWKIRGLLGAALAVVLSCGPSDAEAVRIREGSSLEGISECPTLLCAGFDERCTELLFEYGRSPPLCVVPREICERVECVEPGRECVLFDGIPLQLRCRKP